MMLWERLLNYLPLLVNIRGKIMLQREISNSGKGSDSAKGTEYFASLLISNPVFLKIQKFTDKGDHSYLEYISSLIGSYS